MGRKDWVLWSQRILLWFPSYFQLQNVDLPIILLSVLDPWILMYAMNAIDRPGWSIQKETRADISLSKAARCATAQKLQINQQ